MPILRFDRFRAVMIGGDIIRVVMLRYVEIQTRGEKMRWTTAMMTTISDTTIVKERRSSSTECKFLHLEMNLDRNGTK